MPPTPGYATKRHTFVAYPFRYVKLFIAHELEEEILFAGADEI